MVKERFGFEPKQSEEDRLKLKVAGFAQTGSDIEDDDLPLIVTDVDKYYL